MCIIWSEVSDPCPRAQILLLHIWVLSCELQENWVTMLSTSDKVRNIDKFNHSYLIKGNTYPRVSQSNYCSIFWLFYTVYVPHFSSNYLFQPRCLSFPSERPTGPCRPHPPRLSACKGTMAPHSSCLRPAGSEGSDPSSETHCFLAVRELTALLNQISQNINTGIADHDRDVCQINCQDVEWIPQFLISRNYKRLPN